MRFKRIRLGVVCTVTAVIACVCIYMIKDINTRFPDSTETELYTETAPANENGLQMKPMGFEVYTYDEFAEKYPDYYGEYSYVESDKENWKILVFKIEYYNTSDHELTYHCAYADIIGVNSGFGNGASPIDSPEKKTIAPGETQNVTLSTGAGSNRQVRKEWINKLDTDTFYYQYQYYPVKKVLVFDHES